MKNIAKLILSILILTFSLTNSTYAECGMPDWKTTIQYLADCKPANAVDVSWNAKIEWGWGFWKKIITIANNIMLLAWVLAIWGLVYGGIIMTISAWNDEKINKWKKVFTWTILWFLGILSAWWIINIIIRLMFELWELNK